MQNIIQFHEVNHKPFSVVSIGTGYYKQEEEPYFTNVQHDTKENLE